MDILPTSLTIVIIATFKILFIIIALIIVVVNYLHTNEAKKMERRLSVSLPGSVHLAMSFQLVLSIMFLICSVAILFMTI